MNKITFLILSILLIVSGLYHLFLMIKGYGLTYGYTKDSLQKESKGEWYKGYSWYVIKLVYPANIIQKMQIFATVLSFLVLGFLSIVVALGNNN